MYSVKGVYMAWSVGVDLGGTKIEMAAVDESGTIVERMLKNTDTHGGAQAIEKQIVAGVQELQSKMGSQPIGVGVGVAGQIDAEEGIVHFAPNLPGWREIPLKERLVSILLLPVVVLNDVRAATWAEWKHGAGKGYDDFVCVFLGTGIGGGVVSHGKMLTGCTNSAGEIGHMTVDLYGPACTCGNRGCLEAWAGGWAIARSAKEAVFSSPKAATSLLASVGGKAEALTAKHVIEEAKKGDPLAQGIIDKAFEAIIAGSISLINAFNPRRLIFGGGLAAGLSVVVEVVDTAVRGRALKAATDPLEVVAAKLGNEAGVIGAATFAMQEKNGR
jgi:glucokinase